MPFLRGINMQQKYADILQSIKSVKELEIQSMTNASTEKENNSFSDNNSSGQFTNLPKEKLNNFWEVWHNNSTNRGLLYERYIGYLCEMAGYNIFYNGILHKSGDMGRDLICQSKNGVLIIQCKCLSSGNVYPKDIHQLYGTSIQYRLENPRKLVRGMLYTTTGFTYEAIAAAGILGIYLKSKQILPQRFPIIRCISKLRLYYLPDDWDYFFIDFDIRKGDVYYQTVEEAEQNGFVWAHQV